MKISDYPEQDMITYGLYTPNNKLVGAIRIDNENGDLIVEDKYQGSKGNWKSRNNK